jgi:Ca-activated chloride channel family protein
MTRLWTRIEHPAVQNLCVDWGMEAEYYPELMPDLYATEPLWLYARLPLEPREVSLCGELDGRPWETVSRLSPQEGTEALATLWARGKIEALEDSRLFGVDPAEVRVQVVDLALRFGLLTPYTSLVAVDRTPMRPPGERLEAASVPGLLPAGSTAATGFAPTATGWPAQLALSLLSLFIATGMLLLATPSRVTRPPAAPPSP